MVDFGVKMDAEWSGAIMEKKKRSKEDEDRRYDEQFDIFLLLRDRIENLLEQYGRADCLGELGDFSAHYDFVQSDQVKVSVANLDLFQPFIVYQLQDIVKEFPGWEIVYAVTLDDHLKDWPNMGLYIRGDEIIDTLQRQYFPKKYQSIEYAGSRRGTEPD
jgi:hypothetical protein